MKPENKSRFYFDFFGENVRALLPPRTLSSSRLTLPPHNLLCLTYPSSCSCTLLYVLRVEYG